jgi:hypothetical protein
VNDDTAYTHDSLGKFLPISGLPDMVEGQGNWGERAVVLVLSREGGTLDQAADWAMTFLGDRTKWVGELNEECYSAYYEIWRDNWADEGESLCKQDWLSRLKVTRLEFSPERFFTVMHDDGDLFGGHSVVAWGSESEGVKSVSLFG